MKRGGNPAMELFGVEPEQWTDWRWHMRNRIRSIDGLERVITATEREKQAVADTEGLFNWSITPYYASLMDGSDHACGIRRQVVPLPEELDAAPNGTVDPLEEVAHSPVKNLIHNYEDRVAFCVTAECAIYCRYCLRKRMVGHTSFMMRKSELAEGLSYIAAHPEIRDVLLTGGDPLTLGDGSIDWLLSELRAIDHVEIIRIGTRMPVKLPFRITDELCGILSIHHPVWVNTHFNHPGELTPEAAASIDRLLRAGVPVGNQTVLLRGVNDYAPILKDLLTGLVRIRVRPYYLYQAQYLGGTSHFRTSIEEGMLLMQELQGRVTGFAIPEYVLDTPYGKVPLNRTYVLGRNGDYVLLRTTRGTLWAEPNPAPSNEEFRILPEVEIPPETASISPLTGMFVPGFQK